MAQACCAIRGTNRWAMTGTPIQNRAADFGSLLEYLYIYPFSNYKTFDREIVNLWLKSEDKDVSRMRKLVNCISLCRTKGLINLPRRQDETHFLDFCSNKQEYYESIKRGTREGIDEARAQNPLAPGQYLNILQWLNELRLICNYGVIHSRKSLDKAKVVDSSHDQPWNRVCS